MRSSKSEKGFSHIVILFIVVAVVVGAGLLVYRHVHNNAKSTSNLTSAAKKVKHPGVIQSEKFSTSVGTNGAAVSPTTIFTTTDKKIYVVLLLKNAKTTNRLEYVRYLNNKFVDNGSIPLNKDGAHYASFAFTAKTGKSHPKGTYRVKVYTNGIYEMAANYTVQ